MRDEKENREGRAEIGEPKNRRPLRLKLKVKMALKPGGVVEGSGYPIYGNEPRDAAAANRRRDAADIGLTQSRRRPSPSN